MKKVLLLLTSLACLPIFAQKSLPGVFDFTNPTHLTPSITPFDYEGGKLNVFDKVFEEGDGMSKVTMAFSSGVARNGGAQIVTHLVNGTSYSLRLASGTLITFTAPSGGHLSSITLSDDSSKGDLSLPSGQPGTLSGMSWTAGTSNVSSVSLFTDGGSQWRKVTVQFTAPQYVINGFIDLSEQVSSEKVSSFKSAKLIFPCSMTNVSTTGINITGTGLSSPKALTVTPSDDYQSFTLSLPNDEVFNTDGDYVIHVPEGSFQNAQGYGNSEISYSFKVYEARNTLNPILDGFSPALGKVDALPTSVKVTFEKLIKLAVDKEGNPPTFDIFVDDEWEATLEDITVVENVLEIKPISSKKFGTFVIKVPAEAIHTTAYGTSSAEANDRWNDAFEITYTVDKPFDPLEEPTAEVNALKAKIQSETNPIGYPAAGSPAETAITNALNGLDNTELDNAAKLALLNEAKTAYYAETNVVMPTENEWYNIKSVNNADPQKELYLGYTDGKVTVETQKDNAAAFQFIKGTGDYEGKYFFKTADEQYITILPSTKNNVVDQQGKASALTLTKLLVSGIDNEKLLGLFSISGWLGRDANDVDLLDAAEAINFTDKTITSTGKGDDEKFVLSFTEALSSAFTFIGAKDPTIIDPVEPVCALSVTSVLTTQKTVTLTFTNLTKVNLADVTKVYFSTDVPGDQKVTVTDGAPQILTKSTEEDNSFVVHLDGLKAGKYYLQMPMGTFDFTVNDKPVTDQPLFKEISLTEPERYFNDSYTTYNVMQVIDRNTNTIDKIRDIDLNELVILAEVPKFYSDLVPNPKEKVQIVNAYYMSDVVGYGHFVEYPEFANDYPAYANGYKAIKLVMDSPVTAGQLDYRPDTYSFIIPEGAFGDAKYKDYLSGVSGVNKDDCIVNPKIISPSFIVDNNNATIVVNSISTASGVNAESMVGESLSNRKIEGVYYNLGVDGYDSSDNSLVINKSTDMSQITNPAPFANEMVSEFTGIVLRVAQGKGTITVNAKTNGSGQLAIQIGNATPTLTTCLTVKDVVVDYNVTEDTYVYLYAVVNGSSAPAQRAISANAVKIYSFNVNPGATGITAVNATSQIEGTYYTLDGRSISGVPTKKGIYIVNGKKVVVK